MVRGEAGVGKTSLLDFLTESASDLRVLRAVGIEAEMELPFAALRQLCAPMLDAHERLPAPQRDALETVFGLCSGPPPDPFLVGLAVLGLFSDVAEARPLVCVVDDAQWLDAASAQVLGFVARRLFADSVLIVVAARDPGPAFSGLPALSVEGLRDADARALLASALRWPLDRRVSEQIVAETRGNPLALLELPRGLSPAELAGGFGLPTTVSVSGKIEEAFVRRLHDMPEETKRLLLVAAAEPVGDPELLWAAAEQLGISSEAAAPAHAGGLLDVGAARVRFRHPLVRTAIYRAARQGERQEVHRALAEVTDPDVDRDRRAWHRARAAAGPDEEIAAELERSADQAKSRGGLAAAAAFLERAVELTLDPALRADRALAAAQAHLQGGAFDAAFGLLVTAEAGVLDDLQAQLELLRGQITFASGHGHDAPPLLLDAAARLELLDVALARDTYLDAWGAAMLAGRLADSGHLRDVSAAARMAPRLAQSRPSDLLLDGLATLVTDGPTAAAPILRRAATAIRRGESSPQAELRWGWLATGAPFTLWDFEATRAIQARQLQLARDVGALAQLSLPLAAESIIVAWSGDFTGAASLIAEGEAINEATGARVAPFGAFVLGALQGRQAETSQLIEATITEAVAWGQGVAIQLAQWAAAILYNGLGRYEEALVAAQQATEDVPHLFTSGWALPEQVEAAVRCGNRELASAALERLAEATTAGGSDWGLGIEARSRALLSDGEAADALYREGIERLGRAGVRPELARAHLLYGEWLRRERSRMAARHQLRAAHELLESIGMEAFAERAARELLATGEHARKRTVETREDLTAQEIQIAQMARDGMSNPEIGTRLFISPRTVKYHLQKVFSKLDITSRSQLERVLPRPTPEALTA